MEQKDGGPAFPQQPSQSGIVRPPEDESGMSLRDYFAGQAIAGIAAGFHAGIIDDLSALIHGGAVLAYEMADAMLREREKART